MPPSNDTERKTQCHVDEQRHAVQLQRKLPVAPEQAFAFLTEPKHVKMWWDPSGLPLVECAIDLRVGGELRYVGANKEAPPFVGTYVEIEPPTRLVFNAMGAIGTFLISAIEEGSLVEVEIRAPSAEALAAMMAMGVAQGTAQTLDNLLAYAETGN